MAVITLPRDVRRAPRATFESFEIRAAADADRERVAELIREMIPGVAADARLAWLYENNPAGRALTWLAFDHGELAGCTSYFPWRLQVDGTPILGALGGDGFIRPAFRRRGIGGILHAAARAGMSANGIGCMYGAPGAMNVTPLKHGGSREVGHVARWARPLRATSLGVRHPIAEWAAGIALAPRSTATLDPMERGDARVDEIWSAFAPTVKLAAIRDAEFYAWRFLDAPAQKEVPYVILEGQTPIGACALELMNEGRWLRIVDVMARPGAWHRCLTAISRFAAETTDAELVDIKLFVLDARRRQMWRSGFLERHKKPFLVVIPPDGDRRLVDPTRWFYGGADSDIDALD